MLIRKWKKKAIEFSRIERIEEELLRQVPACCELDEGSNAESRIFPAPADANEQDLLQDWKEFVRPELRHLFRSAKETVEADLGRSSDDAAVSAARFSEQPYSSGSGAGAAVSAAFVRQAGGGALPGVDRRGRGLAFLQTAPYRWRSTHFGACAARLLRTKGRSVE